MGVRLLVILVGEIWQSKDNKMIVADNELAEILITSPKVIRETMNLLIAEKLIERLIRGSAIKGRSRICSQYVLGSMFAGVPLMMRGKDKGKPYPKSQRGYSTTPLDKGTTGVLQLPRRGERATPSPICTLNTHTKKLPLAFTKENWLNRGKQKYPDWDADNMTSAFYSGEMKEGLNGNWPSFQDKCYHLRITSAKTTPAPAPKSWQRQPSKPQESACYSPPLPPLDYTDPIVLRDEIYFALRDRNGIAGIVGSAKGQGVTSDLVDVAVAHADTRLKDYYASKNNKLSRFDSLKFEGETIIKT
jgi:hypothetical protein